MNEQNSIVISSSHLSAKLLNVTAPRNASTLGGLDGSITDVKVDCHSLSFKRMNLRCFFPVGLLPCFEAHAEMNGGGGGSTDNGSSSRNVVI